MKKVLFLLLLFLLMVPSNIYAQESPELNTTHEIIKFIESQPGKISLYYENLVSGQQIYYHPEEKYYAASTIKLPMSLYIYEEAGKGKVDLEEKLTYKSYHYYEGTGVIRYEKVGTQYTIRDLVKKSIVHSDNIAYIMLVERFGRSNLENYMHQLGGKYAYPNNQNISTALDMSLYLKRLYQFSIESKLGQELIQYYKTTDFNKTIPGTLKDVEVAHKVGYIPYLLEFNDTAIVYDEEPYILVIMTNGIPYEEEERRIAELATIIHNEHENLIASRAYPFHDVDQNFWAAPAVKWAYENNLVLGYPDETFRPNEPITEAEFASILIKYFDIELPALEKVNHWADPMYQALERGHFPLKGYNNLAARKVPMTRRSLANIFYSTQVNDTSTELAINWMYRNHLTSGRYHTGDKVADYDEESVLTRAQAVVFFRNLYDQGITQINNSKLIIN